MSTSETTKQVRYEAMAVDNSRQDGRGETCGHAHKTEEAAQACGNKHREANPCKWHHFRVREV